VAYVLSAWLCYRVIRHEFDLRDVLEPKEKWLWRMIVGGLVLLGINKQLDLQSAFTEIGRILAAYQGWYETRRTVQVWFIATVGLLAVVMILLVTFLARRTPLATRIAVTGCFLLVAFVFIRAASFHHFDRLISHVVGGVRMNWVFELGGLLIICLGARMRTRIACIANNRSRRGCD
jgi:high-affinity Fe2+/Pb2+ permease